MVEGAHSNDSSDGYEALMPQFIVAKGSAMSTHVRKGSAMSTHVRKGSAMSTHVRKGRS